MPATTLHTTIMSTLNRLLPKVVRSQLQNLGLIVAGAAQNRASRLSAIGHGMGLPTKQASKEQRIRRFTDNVLVTQETHYAPIVQYSLLPLRGQWVHLLMDRVLLGDHHNLLVVSVSFRRRSIPVVFDSLSHRGCSNEEQQRSILARAVKLLPPKVRVSVHGDSEFRSQGLFEWLRGEGHDALLGIRGDMMLFDRPEAPEEQGCTIQQKLGESTKVMYLSNVYLTHQRHGPINLLAWWAKDDDDKPLVRGIQTNLPATPGTYQIGGRRMSIETVFRDLQSQGFDLDKSAIKSRPRLARLLLPLLIVYLWFISVGRWVVRRGYRHLLDSSSSRDWGFSLFQLGFSWKTHLQALGLPFPPLLQFDL